MRRLELMAKISQPPTPYADVNVLLHLLLKEVQAALGDQFIGMYLYGSLASGDFDEQSSDVDFVVVTRDEIADDLIPKLRAVHERIAASGLKWAPKLEGSYISRRALRRYDPNDIPRPQYNEGQFFLALHGSDWIIQRHVLREHSVAVAGPPIKPWIDPVTPDELRGAVAGVFAGWWASYILIHPKELERAGYQPFAVLTMCRALYAFEHGEIVSKSVAARRAMESLDARWKPLIERALAQQSDLSADELDKTIALIRYTLERAHEWESRHNK
jgi:predicted nucleotidyltransferase